MRAVTIALCLLATPALADLGGSASVIDGDTIEVHGQRIRLHGIDAIQRPAGPLTAIALTNLAGTFAAGHLGHVEGEVQQGEGR